MSFLTKRATNKSPHRGTWAVYWKPFPKAVPCFCSRKLFLQLFRCCCYLFILTGISFCKNLVLLLFKLACGVSVFQVYIDWISLPQPAYVLLLFSQKACGVLTGVFLSDIVPASRGSTVWCCYWVSLVSLTKTPLNGEILLIFY